MLETYPAVLRGDRIVWRDDKPALSPDTDTLIYVTVALPSAPPTMRGNGVLMAAILEEIAAQGDTQWPTDAVAWQRGIRADRNVWENGASDDAS